MPNTTRPSPGGFTSTLDEVTTASTDYRAVAEGSAPWSITREDIGTHTRDYVFNGTAVTDLGPDYTGQTTTTQAITEHETDGSTKRIGWTAAGYTLDRTGSSSSSAQTTSDGSTSYSGPDPMGYITNWTGDWTNVTAATDGSGYTYHEAGTPGAYTFNGSGWSSESSSWDTTGQASSSWVEYAWAPASWAGTSWEEGYESESHKTHAASDTGSASGSVAGGAATFDSYTRDRMIEDKRWSDGHWTSTQRGGAQGSGHQPLYTDRWERHDQGGPGGGTATETVTWVHPPDRHQGSGWGDPWTEDFLPPGAAPGSGSITTTTAFTPTGLPFLPAGVAGEALSQPNQADEAPADLSAYVNETAGRLNPVPPAATGGGNSFLYDQFFGEDTNPNAISAPGFWEGMIPIWGSARTAVSAFQNGRVGSGLVHTALAVSDLALIKTIATIGIKGVVKAFGRSAADVAGDAAGRAATKAAGQPIRMSPGAILTSQADKLREYAKNVKSISGFTDVFIHGSRDGKTFEVLHNGQWVKLSHRDLANFLKSQNITGNIRLISCFSGTRNLAQNLANKLGVTVKAPTNYVMVHPNGVITAPVGTVMRDFLPGVVP